MKILSITAGAGPMYCGSCLRDNALARELIRQGHDVVLLPLYTPTRTDDVNVSSPRVFFGGISIYLQQKLPIFRRTPKFLDKLWDLPGVISLFAGRGVEVDPAQLGALTVSILEGAGGRQRKEIDNLVDWLLHEPAPDLVTLPYTLLIALARPLKQATGRPVVCSLQGEELFLDGLTEPWRARALDLIRRQVDDVDAFIAVSHHEARHMRRYLGIPEEKLHVVPLGIATEGHSLERRARPGTWNVGFLGRIAPEKGLHVAAEAYRTLRERGGLPPCCFHVAGYMAPEKRPYFEEVRRRFREWGLEAEFRHWGEVDREGKIRFLQSLDVFSMPATYDEPKGLPVLEAMANGVPVVQPRRGAFPEMIEATGGGLLVDPDSPGALADAWHRILADPALAQKLGRNGCEAVHRDWTLERMALRTAGVYRRVIDPILAATGAGTGA